MTDISRKQVLAYRLRVNHLGTERLDRTALLAAAHSGLQDGSPRSGLLSLAARVNGVEPDDWRGDGLTQVFGPRGAIYIVPQEDVAVFTLGLLPRSPDRVAGYEQIATRVHEVLSGRPMRQTDVIRALPDIGGTRGLRWAATLGTLVPVWDAVDTIVHPATAPLLEPEAARLDLARRFFRCLGPATVANLQWWLDGLLRDAAATVSALGDELVPATVEGQECLVSAETLQLLEEASSLESDVVHLLPPDDVYINRLHRELLVPDPVLRKLLWPQAPPPGALIIGGEVAGTWRRRGGSVAISQWCDAAPSHRRQVEAIAAAWPLGDNAGRHVLWESD